MKIFISASSSKNEFITSIKALINSEYSNRHTCIYIPWDPTLARDATLLDRIKYGIIRSHLIIMEATPDAFRPVGSRRTEWVTNQGVLIEYGIIVGLDWLNKLCIYCEESVSRKHIHPTFHKAIDTYSISDLETFKKKLRIIIREREQVIEEEAIRMDLDVSSRSMSLAGSTASSSFSSDQT
jgi:hypothetical protein